MNPKLLVKIAVDILMTLVLLLLMAYSLIGEAAHERLGIGMFALFIMHHALNSHWRKNLFCGKYTALRILQSCIVALLLLCIVGSTLSGIILSRHVFAFLPISGGSALARTVHMLSGYWGFVLMSLHLGLHWSTITGMAGHLFRKPSAARTWTVRILGLLISAYGVYAFLKRSIGEYLLLRTPFVFFDFGEPVIFFLIDYIAVMSLFVWIGHYLSWFALSVTASKRSENRT